MSFLPGWFPGAVAASRSLRFVQSATEVNPGTDIVVPSGVLAGDLLVFHNMCRTAFSAVAPSGFTLINTDSRSDSGSTVTVSLYYKVAAGTESGTTLTGMADDSDNAIELLHFRAIPPMTSITVGDAEGYVSASAPSLVCSASAGNAPLVVLGAYVDGDSSGLSSPAMSPSEDASVFEGGFSMVKYKIYNISPQDTTISMVDNGNFNGLQSCYLQCNF